MSKVKFIWLMLFCNVAAHADFNVATIYGKSLYPSEYIPSMNIYARNVKTGQTYRLAIKTDQMNYKMVLPAPADYIFYSWTMDKSPVGATYSTCGVNCSDQTPRIVHLNKGQTIKNFVIDGYYYKDAKDMLKYVPLPPKNSVSLK